MGKGGKKATKRQRTTTVKDLPARGTKAIKGGRAGGDQPKYMDIKLKEVFISS